MRNALLLAVAVAAGCNLTYDREGVKFTPPVTPESCTGITPDFCQLATRAFCTDLASDAENCGACGTPCQPQTACAGTAAAPVCATPCGSLPGYLVCGAGTEHPVCANTLNDPNNCGTCGEVCASGVCNSGVCALACGGTTPDVCGTGAAAYCANLQTDLNNCGACSKLCTATCTAGVCDAGLVVLDVVPALPINGKSWNDYVQQDSATGAAIDVACDPAGSAWCTFGAELKTVTVPGRSDCTGLTMSDALGAFQWDCVVSPTVHFTSSRKRSSPMKGLLDLVDVANGAWKRNAVTLFLNGVPYGVSPRTSWWTNPIVKGIPAGGVLGSAGTIYVADGSYTGTVQITASKVGLVVPPGTLPAPTAGIASLVTADTNAPPAALPRDYLWIEGAFDTGLASTGIGLHGVRRSALWNAVVSRTAPAPGSAAVLLDNSSSYNYLAGVSTVGSDVGIQLNGTTTTFNVVDAARVEGAATYGIDLASTSTNFFLSTVVKGRGLGTACVHLVDAKQNGFRSLDASSCGAGIYVEGIGSINNTFRDVRVAASPNEGVLVIGGSSNRFVGLVSVENQGNGVTVQGSDGNVFSDVVVAANGGRAFTLGTAKNNVVTSLTAARNAGGVELSYASNNVLTSLAIDAAGSSSGLRLGSSSGNTFAYVAVANGGVALSEDLTSIDNGFFGELRVDDVDSCQTTSTAPSFTNGAASTTGPGCIRAGTRSIFAKVATAKLFDPGTPPFLGTSTDTVNKTWTANPTRITSLDDPAVDWTAFDHPHRGWVKAAGAIGPLACFEAGVRVTNVRDQASCTGVWAGDAEIYDWALRMGDPRLTGVPTPADPTANHLVDHKWSTGTVVVFDPSAQELMDDGLGNEDGLCDAPLITPPEECLYTPDFGAYQGEGTLGPAMPADNPNEFYRTYSINGR